MISQSISGASVSSSPGAKPKSTETSTTPLSKESTPKADDGVKKLLAMRLESLLEENVRIKEKVSMLKHRPGTDRGAEPCPARIQH